MTTLRQRLLAWNHKNQLQRAGSGASVRLSGHSAGAVPQHGDRGTIVKCDRKTVLVEFEQAYGKRQLRRWRVPYEYLGLEPVGGGAP